MTFLGRYLDPTPPCRMETPLERSRAENQRFKANGAANPGIPEIRMIRGVAPRSFHDTEKTIAAFHRGPVSRAAQHHHFGSIGNGSRSGTPRQRDFSFLVGHQILTEGSHGGIGSLLRLRSRLRG